jgi:hypothetical protein
VFDNQSDDLEEQRQQLANKFKEITEKTADTVLEEEAEEMPEIKPENKIPAEIITNEKH